MACTTLGLYTSTVSLLQIISSMPNQSAMRMMVPRLPGSCTPSSTSVSLSASEGNSSGVISANFLNTAKTCCGWHRKLTFVSSSAETTILSYCKPSISWYSCANHSSVAAIIDSWSLCLDNMSCTIFGPSATKDCCASRFFFISRECKNFILFLLSIMAFSICQLLFVLQR